MRRRLLLLFLLLGAFLLGAGLASGPLLDALEDLANDARVAWYSYRMSAGSAGTIYVMIAGFLLGQGLFLAARQLWRGLLRGVRARLADLDAARDLTTGIPSRYALQRFLEKNLRWCKGDPSTRQVALALFRIEGLEPLNESKGTLRGTELLQALARAVHDAGVPLSVSGLARVVARARLRPRLILFAGTPPSRCPARVGGGSFALGFRGVDARKAFVVTRDLAAELQAIAAEREPKARLAVKGALVLASAGATVAELERAGEAALAKVSTPGGVAAAHEAGEGAAAMLDEFKELERVEVSFARVSAGGAPLEDRPRKLGDLALAWVKGWGPALGCLAAAPILLGVTSRGGEIKRAFPWPMSLRALPIVDANDARTVPISRATASPISDGIWSVDAVLVVQVEPELSTPAHAGVQIRMTIANRTTQARRLSMFDVLAVDREGRRLAVHPKASLAFADPLGARTIEPGAKWSGWLQFTRKGSGVRGLILQPSRESRLYLPLQ